MAKDISASAKSEQVYLHIVDLSEASSIVKVRVSQEGFPGLFLTFSTVRRSVVC